MPVYRSVLLLAALCIGGDRRAGAASGPRAGPRAGTAGAGAVDVAGVSRCRAAREYFGGGDRLPGEMFSALMSLPAGDDLAHFKYTSTEYFVTGTANGQPYKTRIVVRKPADNSRFSGIVLAESMHPSGNAWMFHFTHTYTMTSGHIGVEIVTSDPAQFVEFNGARYKDLRIQPGPGERDPRAGRRAAAIEPGRQSARRPAA